MILHRGPCLTMPVDFDMMLSASPPNFGLGFHSYHNGYRSRSLQDLKKNKSVVAFQRSNTTSVLHHQLKKSPLRSILISRPESVVQNGHDVPDNKSSNCLEVPKASEVVCGKEITKVHSDTSMLQSHRKKVCFADDRGLALVSVKVMSEQSYEPPQLRADILASFRRGACVKPEADNPWEVDFKQPAADYCRFRDKLDANFVSVENVVVKDYQIFGTIKVKNIAFEKKVSVRVTFNDWESYVDVPATYVPHGPGCSSSVYDTFSMDIRIPPNANPSSGIQFCVFFECNNTEYWDSNGGLNYKLKPVKAAVHTTIPDVQPRFQTIQPTESWGEFASWHGADTSAPYW